MVKSFAEFMQKFGTEEKCMEFLIEKIWEGIPTCPHCGCTKSYKIEGGKRFKCANNQCYKKYRVTVGTIFESSNIPLTKWFHAMYVLTAHKKGISSVQLAKDIGVTQKTSWFILHRIREALREKGSILLKNDVQVDETYMGGKEKNKHKNKKAKTLAEAAALKTPVVGMRETNGLVVAKVMPWITKKNISNLINEHFDKDCKLITDSAPVYYNIGQRYNHTIINHSEGIYNFDGYHTNGIENFWSQLKRGIYGIYHQISPKHLQRYCDEFTYRYNSRKIKDGDRFMDAISKISGRLSYKMLVHEPEDPKKGGEEDIKFEETLW